MTARSNANKVAARMVNAKKLTNDQLAIAIRKVALDILSNLVYATPVDTGRARANWNTATRAVNTSTTKSVDKAGGSTVSKGQGPLSNYKPGQGIFISNNLPYIRFLNEGRSKQARAGFVQRAVDQATSQVKGLRLKVTI